METLSIEAMALKSAQESAAPAPTGSPSNNDSKGDGGEPASWREVGVEGGAGVPASAPANEAGEEKSELERLKAELEAKEMELASLKERAIILDDPEKIKELTGLVHPSQYQSEEELIRAVCVEKGLDEDDTEREVEYITGLQSPLEKKTRIETYRKMLADSYDAKVAKFVPKGSPSSAAPASAPAEAALPPQAKALFDQSMTTLGETMDALNGIELDGVKFTAARTKELYDLACENLNLPRYWEMKDGKPTGKLDIDKALRDAVAIKYGDIIQKSKIKEAQSQGFLKAAFLKFRPSSGSGGGGSIENLSVDEKAAKQAFEAAQMSFGGQARRGG